MSGKVGAGARIRPQRVLPDSKERQDLVDSARSLSKDLRRLAEDTQRGLDTLIKAARERLDLALTKPLGPLSVAWLQQNAVISFTVQAQSGISPWLLNDDVLGRALVVSEQGDYIQIHSVARWDPDEVADTDLLYRADSDQVAVWLKYVTCDGPYDWIILDLQTPMSQHLWESYAKQLKVLSQGRLPLLVIFQPLEVPVARPTPSYRSKASG